MSEQKDEKKPAASSETIDAKLNNDQIEFLQVLKQLNLDPNSQLEKKKKKAEPKEHKFWSTQPVPQTKICDQQHAPIEPEKKVSDVRKEPYNMPAGFEWCAMDLSEEKELNEVYSLLTENYVEDDDNMFRFDYSVAFLEWALKPPGYKKDWHIGVRNGKTGKLMAFISGIPAQIRIHESSLRMAEINFLCVHKKLRTKRLAPVLIKEITRRVNLCGIWQAAYTAGVVLPMPVAQCRYYHRSLNPKKLIDVGFSRLAPRMTMTRTVKHYKLDKETSIPGFRQMQSKDISQVTKLVTKYLKKMKLAPVLNEEEVKHWLMPREGVVNAYVVERKNDGKITDFCSFYHLPSTIIGHAQYSKLRAAYSYYNVATSVSMENLMADALVMAKICDFDVFNALNLMQNEEFLKNLKFGMGDGELQYYLYNWKCPPISPDEVGLVLC